jgi:hypothetical protein
MPQTDQGTATLIAAVVAAAATLASAAVTAIMARQVAALHPELEAVRHDLASRLAFATFKRERLHACVADLTAAYVRVFQLSHMVGRMVWIEGPQEEVLGRVRQGEETIHECNARIDTAISTVAGLRAIDAAALNEWRARGVALMKAWGQFMDKAFVRVPGMAARYGGEKPGSVEYLEKWDAFRNACDDLGKLVHELPALIDQAEHAAKA